MGRGLDVPGYVTRRGESTPGDYERGLETGAIHERLAGHDTHFAAINGHLATIALKVAELNLNVQRLFDQAAARDVAAATTANALKEANAARHALAEQHWSPWQKLFASLAGLAALVGVILAIRELM